MKFRKCLADRDIRGVNSQNVFGNRVPGRRIAAHPDTEPNSARMALARTKAATFLWLPAEKSYRNVRSRETLGLD
jgi:hypothetical protein